MSDTLEWPDLVYSVNDPVPALEVGIDYITDKHKAKWEEYILEFTAEYVFRRAIKGSATLWSWGGLSQNLRPAQIPGFNIFHICFGLPSDFMPNLHLYLQSKLGGNNVCLKEFMSYDPDDSWVAVCHIEQGKAWQGLDPKDWIQVSANPLVRKT